MTTGQERKPIKRLKKLAMSHPVHAARLVNKHKTRNNKTRNNKIRNNEIIGSFGLKEN